ncbi:cytochrome P450 [Micractinium conductrix]|uniref:Cytochrome P450 n=1 Tax=Micractinium conductrix TaxID=554055 RepID=A0A2P6VMG0_9CHLO|nr:cytochrome P450 [Micractinium conductrix]|eukprot:PSC75274.1 cytochrome P450 [Micractinium conductrix]
MRAMCGQQQASARGGAPSAAAAGAACRQRRPAAPPQRAGSLTGSSSSTSRRPCPARRLAAPPAAIPEERTLPEGADDEVAADAPSTRQRRGAPPPPPTAAQGGSLKAEAVASNREVSDKLIEVFRSKKPAEWRKLIAYSRQWPVLARGVLDRIEERAAEAAAAAGEEGGEAEEARELRKLGRRVATVHEELTVYQQLLDKFRAAPSRDWEGMVSLHRGAMGGEFFKYVDLKIRSAHDAEQEQEALVVLAAQLAALVEAFDRVQRDDQAMESAAESFSSLLEVGSLEEADKKIDELAASGKLDPALLLMMAKAYAGSKETDITREEVKDVMAHLYFKAKESFAQQAPKEVRILKYLLTVDSERDRAQLLAQAFEPGPQLEAGDVDYLCTTPPELMNTIENVLTLYDASRSKGTMAGEAASLMNPEVIEQLRTLQKQIRRQYLSPSAPAASTTGNATTAAAALPGPAWHEVDALLRRWPLRHGRQAKPAGAVPADLQLLLIHMTNKNAELHGVPVGIGPVLFRWFAFAHTFNKSAGQSNHDLQSPVPPCHFYVDHRYRILYIRNTKTAGTSISSTLGMKENPKACKEDPTRCYAKCKGKQVCMEYLWDAAQIQRVINEYTVFTFVRNPWARAISSWLHIHKHGLRDQCQDPFPVFAQAPSAYGAKCLVTQGMCCMKRFGWTLEHIEPQSRCLFTAGGRPVVDFIGSVENLDEDMQTLLDIINSRRPMGTEALTAPALPRLMVAAEKVTEGTDRARQYAELYMGANNTALHDVRSYFHADFSLLQYPSDIPWEADDYTRPASPPPPPPPPPERGPGQAASAREEPQQPQQQGAQHAAEIADASEFYRTHRDASGSRQKGRRAQPRGANYMWAAAAAAVWYRDASAVVAAALCVLVAAAALAVAARRTAGAGAGKPIPAPFPFWSDLVIEVTKTGDFPDLVALHAKHGPVFWWRLLGRRLLMVGSYEAVMTLLKGEYSIVEADHPPSVKALIGPEGLSNVTGKTHMRIKRLTMAAFTPKAVRGYLPRIQTAAEKLVSKWAAAGDVLVYQEMKLYAFRVAVELIVGFDSSWTDDSPQGFAASNALFKDWLAGLFSFPVAIPGTAFARGLKARRGLMQRIHASLDLLEARAAAQAARTAGGQAKGSHEGSAAEHQQQEQEQRTALSLLLDSRDESGAHLSRSQIADTVLVMLFAGHDTSATSLTRCFHHLHRHPEAVQRLRDEQAAVVAKHGPYITEAALEDMPYADGVVREALRITPIIAGFSRVAVQDFELCGYWIRKGTRLQCSLAQPLLTDPRWAGEAEPLRFSPERWMHGAAQKAGAWIPFGGGPRLCLGWLLAMAEMKALLAVVFRSPLTLTLLEPNEPWLFFPLARPKHGMPARFAGVPGGGPPAGKL